MPHAALCVGAATDMPAVLVELALFQCRTRLCVWCSQRSPHQGGRIREVSMPHAALWVVQHHHGDAQAARIPVSMPHAALWVVQQPCSTRCLLRLGSFNAARGFVGGATVPPAAPMAISLKFQCRTRLCGWCNGRSGVLMETFGRFNAARGFVGGATRKTMKKIYVIEVSMPHAALWVVQQ